MTYEIEAWICRRCRWMSDEELVECPKPAQCPECLGVEFEPVFGVLVPWKHVKQLLTGQEP